MKTSLYFFVFLSFVFSGCTSLESTKRQTGTKVFTDSISGNTNEMDGKRKKCLNGTLPGMAFLLEGFDRKTSEECKKNSFQKSDSCIVAKTAVSYSFDSKFQKESKEWPFVCSVKINYFY